MLLTLFSPQVIYWIKTLSKFISAQLIVQALGVVSGIFLVRTLDQTQYALYTIALTMQTTMMLLADMGISVGLSAIGGKVWQDKHRFGQLINTAMHLRYYLSAISITVVIPILMWMLIKNGASIIYAILITIVVLIGLYFQLTTGVLFVVPRLQSQISRVQNLDLLLSTSRLALLGLAYFTFLNAAVVMATSSVAAGLQRFLLGYWVNDSIDTKAPINKEDQKFILAQIRELAPNGIFFSIQGQITVWLLSIFGTTETVAEAGALGRIAIIFTVIGSVMQSIILPSFTRCQSTKILRHRYFQILGCFLILGLILIGIAALFPGELLWILGNKYSNLKDELLLMMLGTVLGSLVGTMSSLNLAKAWVQYVWIEIPLRIIIQIILLLTLDISTVKGALFFGIYSQISPFLVNIFLTYRGLSQFNKANASY
jgi:O-antigen/teichoic acid export membrane protein